MSTTNPSVATLRRAIAITEQIEKLEAELKSVLRGTGAAPAASAPKVASSPTPAKAKGRKGKKKRTMSPEARARIVAAQKLRWAKVRAAKAAKGRK